MSKELELTSIFNIKSMLDTKFGKGNWSKWEPETISMELGEVFTPLFLDKLSLLRILEVSPLQAFEDPALFLYAAEVINNNTADFQSVPHLTLLEAAYAITSIKKVLIANKVVIEYPEALKKAVGYILNLEGASEAIPPFEFIDSNVLGKGQTDKDTEAKKKAIVMYTTYMDSL